jgi:probable rRNA maturation factor
MIQVYSQIVDENKWENINTDDIAKTAIELVDDIHEISEDKQVSIVFTSNSMVQELNNTYRGKDEPTNVLSFAFNDDGSNNLMLGELFIAYDVIEAESNSQNKPFDNHLLHILIHGVLHLLGYDHIEDVDAKEMEALEIELLNKINIENPY